MSILDIGIIDSPLNVVDPDSYKAAVKNDISGVLEHILEKQYKDFENLGVDMLYKNKSFFDDDTKLTMFIPMVNYINDNYITIGEIDSLQASPSRMIIAGEYIYSFICVDNLISIIPAFIENIGCVDIQGFDDSLNVPELPQRAQMRIETESNIFI